MPKALKKLAPIGSSMNDAAYPFRGEHRVPAAMNHGHSSVVKLKPTTLAVRISGSNLSIEQLEVPKGQELKCELGIDGGLARPVDLACTPLSGLAVPGDGRDYNLTATVCGDNKHYCKMTFNGSEGNRYLRVRAPPRSQEQVAQIRLCADGRELEPADGWYAVPLQTEECSITLSESSNASLLRGQTIGPSARRVYDDKVGTMTGQWQSNEVSPLHEAGATPIVLQAVRDLPEGNAIPVLESVKTGQSYPLSDNASVAVPTQEGPFRLRLPSSSSHCSSSGAVSPLPVPAVVPTSAAPTPPPPPPPAPAPAPPVTGTTLVPPAPVAEVAAVQPPERIPEIETSLLQEQGVAPQFVVKAAGFQVHLTGANGATCSGMGEAALSLPHKGMQFVSISILNDRGKEVLRQRTQLPCMELPPVEVQVTENTTEMAVTARKGSSLLVSGTPVSDPESGVRVAGGGAMQTISIQQPNGDGSVSSVVLNVIPKTEVAPPAPTNAVGQPDYASWLGNVVTCLKDPAVAEGQRRLQSVAPPSSDAAVLQQFIYDKLVTAVPEFTFVTQPNSLDGVQCPGFNLSASVGNQPPYFVSSNGSIQVSPGNSVHIAATHPSSGKTVGTCRIHLSLPRQNEDELLMARICDSLQRHNLNPAAVAEDLASTNGSSLSSLGVRTVPLLVQCLRKVLEGQLKETVLCTARDGYLENIYTRDQSCSIFSSINNGHSVNIPQHSRLPATGTFPVNEPTFVKLTAKNAAGEIKGETVLTVMGPAPQQPPPLLSSKAVSPHESQPRTPILLAPPPAVVLSSSPSIESTAVATALAPATAPAPAVVSTPAPLGPPSRPTTPILPNTSVLSHHCPPHPVSAGAPAAIPYLDVSMQQVSQDIQIRALTAPGMQIACNIDGVGGNTGKNDVITKVHAQQPHSLELSLIDSYGQIVFQQKLEVPAVSSLVWGLCLQETGMSVDPDGMSTTTTISLDRAPERTLQGNFMPFDTCKPHYVCLRRYLNGIHGICSGELALRLPGYISPQDISSIIHLMKTRNENRIDWFNFERQMLVLSSQAGAPVMRDLIAIIVEACKHQMEGGRGESTGPRVFFRLTGAE